MGNGTTRSVHNPELASHDCDVRAHCTRTQGFIPVGTTAQRGRHMSTSPNGLLPAAICECVSYCIRALVALEIAYIYKSQRKSDGGSHPSSSKRPGRLTATSTIRDILKKLAHHGRRRTVLVTGCYENSVLIVERGELTRAFG